MQPTVVLLGTLDTKSTEYAFVREILQKTGIGTVTVDAGVLGEPGFRPDIDRNRVADAGGGDLEKLVTGGDRGAALAVMQRGAAAIVRELHQEGRIQGALALGGTGGTSLAAAAFRQLPLGFPKLIVSTAASGNTEPYVSETDLILAPSVVDISGLNRISTRVLANAAAALIGMVSAPPLPEQGDRPMVAASMFGVTTACVTQARERLEALGYEVIVFHMTGSGGRAMESLISQGFFAGVLDVTTTELADHLVGGVFDAGPDRLTAAATTGTPQVISVGALDMVNFGPRDSVPPQFTDRNLYEHNASVTLMRTTPDECAGLGAELARKASTASGPVTVVLPLRGISAIAGAGGPFFDPHADDALFTAVRSGLEGSDAALVELDTDINDPTFAEAIVDRLHAAITNQPAS
ncbi:Tm-1-like ATP-binding domain-containing protein [Georgenia halophila]|uniref:Tm-1-like ATP-binding domain-containing protein n=1 Tax=Georgenia halophila TaxID=620889 RepID=A0ABP8LCV0_9MICO